VPVDEGLVDDDAEARGFVLDVERPAEIVQAHERVPGAQHRGCERFVLLSALGAHPRSPFLFLRTKGVLGRDLAALGLAHLHIVTPPFVSDSTVPRVWYERVALAVNVRLAPLLRGPLARLRPVTCDAVAGELVEALATRA